jgi:hypothetical protein
MLEPSLCSGAPSGITTFLMYAGILIFQHLQDLRIVAILLQVPSAVKEGVMLFPKYFKP